MHDAESIAVMAVKLFEEIMHIIGSRYFTSDLEKTLSLLKSYLDQGLYTVFIATSSESRQAIGFISLYESCSLYAEGHFGTIPELYVDPGYRSQRIGEKLLAEAKVFGREKGWTRLEVTTPPLPQFDRSLQFYQTQGFEITGGRKMKVSL